MKSAPDADRLTRRAGGDAHLRELARRMDLRDVRLPGDRASLHAPPLAVTTRGARRVGVSPLRLTLTTEDTMPPSPADRLDLEVVPPDRRRAFVRAVDADARVGLFALIVAAVAAYAVFAVLAATVFSGGVR